MVPMQWYATGAIIATVTAIWVLTSAISSYWGWRKGVVVVEKMRMQSKSVIARYRNKATKALWNDLMDQRIGGIVPLRQEIEGLFPSLIEELESQRTKNPMAWQQTLIYLTPILLASKQTLAKNPMELLGGLLRGRKGNTATDTTAGQQDQTA